MTVPTNSMLPMIDARLSELERERLHLLELRAIYSSANGASNGTAPEPAATAPRPVARPSYLFAPVPEADKIRLVRDSNNKTGISPVILDVTRRYPGLNMSMLVTRILDHIITDDAKINRINVRSMVAHLADVKKLLAKRDGKFYVAG